MRKPRKGTSRRNPRLSKKRLGEGRGGRFHPDGLVTYTFSRLRCKPTASALAAGLCSGAGVAERRAHADQQDTMSDTSTTTADEQPAEQPPFSKNQQHLPNVLGGGVRVLGGGQDTRDTQNQRYSGSTVRSYLPVLTCPGCPGSNQNYCVACARVCAHPLVREDRVWTRDTRDTDSTLRSSRGTGALAAVGVSSPRPPRGQDTPGHSPAVEGVRAR